MPVAINIDVIVIGFPIFNKLFMYPIHGGILREKVGMSWKQGPVKLEKMILNSDNNGAIIKPEGWMPNKAIIPFY